MQKSSNFIELQLDHENPKYKELLNKLDLEDDPDYGVYIEAQIEFNYHYIPAKRYIHPPEPSEFEYEILSVTDDNNNVDITNLLSDNDLNNCEEKSIYKLEDEL